MNAPAALYWYHQQPRQAEHRNSSANRTGPYITELDMTGQPGVLKIVKYVPEETVAAAVVAEGISEYERGLRDGAALEREACAQLVERTSDSNEGDVLAAAIRARATATVKESLTAGQPEQATP